MFHVGSISVEQQDIILSLLRLHSSEEDTRVTQLLRRTKGKGTDGHMIDKCYLGRRDKEGLSKEVTFEN